MCGTEVDYTVDLDRYYSELEEALQEYELTEELIDELSELHYPGAESGTYVSSADETCSFAKPRFAQDLSCVEDAANCAAGLWCAQDIQEVDNLDNV